MKALISSLLLLAVLIGGTVLDTVLLKRGLDRMEAALLAIPPAEEEGDLEEQRRGVTALTEEWERSRSLYVISLFHDEVVKVDELLVALLGTVDAKDPAEYKVALAGLAGMLTHLQRTVLPSLSYII